MLQVRLPLCHTSLAGTPATLVLTLSSGEVVETTDEHPFYVSGKGFVEAKDLGIGTSLVTRAGPKVAVVGIARKEQAAKVYNFTVEDTHTYFVGAIDGGVWVHNKPGNPDPIPNPLPEVRGKPVSPRNVTDEWDSFLGQTPQSDLHPRTGARDPDRIVTQTGPGEYRSIRYGDHEMRHSHYHEETWTYNPSTGTIDVGNTYRPIHPR